METKTANRFKGLRLGVLSICASLSGSVLSGISFGHLAVECSLLAAFGATVGISLVFAGFHVLLGGLAGDNEITGEMPHQATDGTLHQDVLDSEYVK